MDRNPITQLEQITINSKSKVFLKETAKWSLFLSILGFIGIALMLVLGVFSSFIFNNLPESQTALIPFDIGTVMTVVYLALSVLYFFPVYYLLQFSNKMQNALKSKDDATLADAFEMLKSHYKFIGVFTIITISLYILLFVASMFGALV